MVKHTYRVAAHAIQNLPILMNPNKLIIVYLYLCEICVRITGPHLLLFYILFVLWLMFYIEQNAITT